MYNNIDRIHEAVKGKKKKKKLNNLAKMIPMQR